MGVPPLLFTCSRPCQLDSDLPDVFAGSSLLLLGRQRPAVKSTDTCFEQTWSLSEYGLITPVSKLLGQLALAGGSAPITGDFGKPLT